MQDDFSPITCQLLDLAAARCAKNSARLTELRRDVLGLILESPSPSGAYDLLEKLRSRRGPSAPPTVYRALEFLVEQGFIHRVERLSAFVGCIGDGVHAPEHEHAHAAQFLICRQCKRVTELEDHAISHALSNATASVGFRLERSTIEAEGVCAECAAT